jgi:predicted nucleic acid-binding protein
LRFLDTNVFLRSMVRDDEAKADACTRLFEGLERREEEATTTEAVLAEVVYVLTSPRWYRVPREQVNPLLRPLLTAPGLRIANKSVYLRALEMFVAHRFLDFEDAITAAFAEGGEHAIVSYDHDFDRVPGVTRVEP